MSGINVAFTLLPISSHDDFHSSIPKLTISSHVHPLGIRNLKNHCYVNVILQIIYSVLRTPHQKCISIIVSKGKISEYLFDTAHKTPSAQEVEMPHVANRDRGQRVWVTTHDNLSSKGSFSELLFSFVLEQYILCDICTMKSSDFETTSLLYVTHTDFTSVQELLMQEHKQKLCKTCSCCGRDTWHIESKRILQPPKYLIIIVNRITYSNNRITWNRSRMPLDLYIKLSPYKFSLQASVDHHVYSMSSGHYTASINCCGKTFHCNHNKITKYDITDTNNSSTVYILVYKLIMECKGGSMSRRTFVVVGIVECLQPDRGGSELIGSHGADTVVCLFTTGRGVGTKTCGMDNVFPADDL